MIRRSRPDRIVDKDIAVLLQFRPSSGSVPAGIKIKREIIQAVGLHQTPGLALPFLERAAASSSPEALRREAAEAFGTQTAPRAVLVLRRLVEEDRSIEVRKTAVAALSDLSSLGTLSDLAREKK